jgi:hypothetical protein
LDLLTTRRTDADLCAPIITSKLKGTMLGPVCYCVLVELKDSLANLWLQSCFLLGCFTMQCNSCHVVRLGRETPLWLACHKTQDPLQPASTRATSRSRTFRKQELLWVEISYPRHLSCFVIQTLFEGLKCSDMTLCQNPTNPNFSIISHIFIFPKF